jgi:DNA-directed RNA polymerase subunit M/transcription elongation factor TFIIS
MTLPADGPDRIVCPKCSAKIRVNREKLDGTDEFIRFSCPCGRRLKVKASGSPQAGKCPDCGRIVPIPSASSSALTGTAHPESRTAEMSPDDVAMLDAWSKRRQGAPAAAKTAAPVKSEAGLRVCPRCGKPVHMGAIACRECGTHVPKR